MESGSNNFTTNTTYWVKYLLQQWISSYLKLLCKHFVVFLFFFISGFFFYLILKKILDSEIFSSLGTIFYLTYPYLFGQAMFSPKDIPFLSMWLICTYFSFRIFKKMVFKEKIKTYDVFLISFLTALYFL